MDTTPLPNDDHSPKKNTHSQTQSQAQPQIRKPTQLVLLPTRAGIKQKVSIHLNTTHNTKPVEAMHHHHPNHHHRISFTTQNITNPASTPRPPMIPISINSSDALPKPTTPNTSSINTTLPPTSTNTVNSSNSSIPYPHQPPPSSYQINKPPSFHSSFRLSIDPSNSTPTTPTTSSASLKISAKTNLLFPSSHQSASATAHSSLPTTHSSSSLNSSLNSSNESSSPSDSSPPSSDSPSKSPHSTSSSSDSKITHSSRSVPPIDLAISTPSNPLHRPPRVQSNTNRSPALFTPPPTSSEFTSRSQRPHYSVTSSAGSSDRFTNCRSSPSRHSRPDPSLSGLIDIDFGPSFSVQPSEGFAEPSPSSSHPSTPTNDHPFDLPLAPHFRSNSVVSQSGPHSLSSYPSHDDSRRDTLRSLSDIMNPALSLDLFNSVPSSHDLTLTNLSSRPPTTTNGRPVTPPRSNTSGNSLSNQVSHSTSFTSYSYSSSSSLSDSSPPPPSFELIPEPTPKPKTLSLSAPSLLDLDISGRGPSTAHPHTSSRSQNQKHDRRSDEHQDHTDDDHQSEKDLPSASSDRHGSVSSGLLRYSNPSNYSFERPRSRQVASSYENDPYFPSGLNDEDENDDTQSIQYTGSSCDEHRNPPQESIPERSSPYMNRELRSGPSSSTQTGPSSKKSFTFFKLGHSKHPYPMESDHHQTNAYGPHSSSKRDMVDPSPVSSLTSFHTTGSKASSKNSSSSRMARLLSRVTGHTSLGSLSAVSKRAAQQDSSSQNPPPPRPGGAPTKPLARKASLSNLLDTITITRDKSKPTSPPTGQTNSLPSIVPRKSFDMLMRPFTGGKPRATQPQSNSNSTCSSSKLPGETSTRKDLSFVPGSASRPLLKAKRSYDMLKGQLGNGRKSMDDLSNTVCPPLRQVPVLHTKPPTGPSPPSVSTPAPTQNLRRDRSRDIPNRPLPGSQSAPAIATLRALTNASDNHNKQQGQTKEPSRTDSQVTLNPQSSDVTHSTAPKEYTQATTDQNVKPASSRPENNSKASNVIKDTPIIIDDQSIAEWNTLESILSNLQTQRNLSSKRPNAVNAYNRNDLTVGLTNHLLPFLKAEESHHGSIYLDQTKGDRHRQILLGWLELIFDELQEPQPASRAACLDGVSGILESHFFASRNINSNPLTVKKYRSVLISVLNFAVDKLNDKAVYANTLVFAGRMLSLAFFRIEGVGRKLLRALPPVKRMSMRRLLDEMGSPESSSSSESPNLNPFPAYLRELCFVDLASYYHVFSSPSTDSDNLLVQEGDIQVEMSGNWLIRWTASDSDLPFAFYRAYHRQLATYLRPQQQDLLHPSTLISMPGFLFISSSFLDKCDSLVHRSLRSVTTLGPTSNNFNAGESANLAMGAKPKVLELAHRRLVSTALDIIGGPPVADDSTSAEENGNRRRQFFGGLLNLWIRAIAKRTSMWDTRSVFLLLDLLDALFYTVLYTAPIPQVESTAESQQLQMVPKLVESALELFDLNFILDITRRILLTADNTVCILRTVAFIYSQFEAFTNSPEMLKATCLDLLLDPEVFQHLFLHWNSGVRGYYMRLLVWRLSRLGGVTSVSNGAAHKVNSKPKSKEVIKIILTFNARLDAIRKRHDELSPESQFLTAQDDDRRRRRTTICSTRGVSDKPWAISELPPEEVCAETVDDAYRYSTSSDKPVAKVVSWLKVVKRLGVSSKQKGNRSSDSSSNSSHHQTDLRHQSSPTRSQQHDYQQAQQPAGSERDRSLNLDISQGSKPLGQAQLSEIENESNGRKSESSPRPLNAHAPDSPTFFKFEFELGAEIPRSDSFDAPLATSSTSEPPASPINSNGSSLDGGGRNSKKSSSTEHTSPNGKSFHHDNSNNNNHSNSNVQVSVEPRVSMRFSKRASLLPPAALNMLKDNQEDVPDVPIVPKQYKQQQAQQEAEIRQKKREEEEEEKKKMVYDKSKHAYAMKALAEYEQSLEEEFEWNEKLLEEQDALSLQNSQNLEDHPLLPSSSSASSIDSSAGSDLKSSSNPNLNSNSNSSTPSSFSNLEFIVPRLAVSWPLSFSDDD